MTDITFVNRSRFLAECERAVRDGRDSLYDGRTVVVMLDEGGYSGRVTVAIREADMSHFSAAWGGSDPTRFPVRIRAAATALFNCGCFGEYAICHENGTLSIMRA